MHFGIRRPDRGRGGGSQHPDAITVDGDGGLNISGTTLLGLKSDWLASNHPVGEGETVEIVLKVPSGITTIGYNAFNPNTSKFPDGYELVSVDFSEADNLEKIENQAFMYCTGIDGVIELPSSLRVLSKFSFGGCTGIDGVILPAGLENLGSSAGGSTFFDCDSLKFVRVAEDGDDVTFRLPDGLKTIGSQTFKECGSLEADVAVIPDSVEWIGSECFLCSGIKTIVVTASDVTGYNGGAFKSSGSHGIGNRIVIFEDYEAWEDFSPSGLDSYENSVTYVYTLHFGENDVEGVERLHNFTVNTVPGDGDYEWYVDKDYEIPKPDPDSVVNTPFGYRPYNWLYEKKVLTTSVKISPEGTDLVLEPGFELLPPEVEFIVDEKEVPVENIVKDGMFITVHLTVSDGEKHTIGVRVSHVLEGYEGSDRLFKYEYEWIDRDGSTNGVRENEDGFGRYNLRDNPDVGSTITVNGKDHERTGDKAYRVVVYGKTAERGGMYEDFYQSANPIIGVSDSGVTDDVVYEFQVTITDPVTAPDVTADDVTADYGYESAEIKAVVKESAGHTYTYRWFGPDEREIVGSATDTLTLPTGISAGTYNYKVEVTATKTDNGDTVTVEREVSFTVNKAEVTVTPDSGQGKYFGQEDPALTYALSKEIGVKGTLVRTPGETVGEYAISMGSLEPTDRNYVLTLPDGHVFSVREYTVDVVVDPAAPDGKDGWYVTSPTVAPPSGHLISTNGGVSWTDDHVTIGDMEGNLEIWIKSDADDGTKGAICIKDIGFKVDTKSPVVSGLVDDGIYCIGAEFAVSDANTVTVTVNGETESASEGRYTLSPGSHTVAVSDAAGNLVTFHVTVNEGHSFEEPVTDTEPTCTEPGNGHRECMYCDETKDFEIDALGHDFGEWTVVVEPTEDEPGRAERECSRCDAMESVQIPPIENGGDHPWIPDDDDVWVPPTVVYEIDEEDNPWIFVVLGSVALLLFLLFFRYERRE